MRTSHSLFLNGMNRVRVKVEGMCAVPHLSTLQDHVNYVEVPGLVTMDAHQ